MLKRLLNLNIHVEALRVEGIKLDNPVLPTWNISFGLRPISTSFSLFQNSSACGPGLNLFGSLNAIRLKCTLAAASLLEL